MDRPRFETSAETAMIARALKAVAIGQTISYAALSDAAGRRVDGSCGNLQSARRRLLKEDRAVFDVIVGFGLKRLEDGEIVTSSERDARLLRRAAERNVMKITAVRDFGSLTEDQQRKHSALAGLYVGIAGMASDKAIEHVGETIERPSLAAGLEGALVAFRPFVRSRP
ncbi:hypothetical protein [Methylobrevis pamukkalensis]|uniref:Uncharacterized protein n=1 Tax=Methylobrevis pamukkalensis TaxID=1439726 RepID=A0A1E3GYT3_9HYPH|nr:hypothetical protein [Methylobrevis pamukkalensis]ODN69227.1 hypothetical protein A6302_03489 [Methylobrevis pamukkalensis]